MKLAEILTFLLMNKTHIYGLKAQVLHESLQHLNSIFFLYDIQKSNILKTNWTYVPITGIQFDVKNAADGLFYSKNEFITVQYKYRCSETPYAFHQLKEFDSFVLPDIIQVGFENSSALELQLNTCIGKTPFKKLHFAHYDYELSTSEVDHFLKYLEW